VAALGVLVASTPTVAQSPPRDPPALQWWEGAVALGGILAISTLDQPVERWVQSHRSAGADALAGDLRHMGQVEVFGTVPVGMAVVGLAAHRPGLVHGSLRVASSLVLAAAISEAGKMSLGRLRPSAERDADDFKPFSGNDAFPSGHTTMAFALATSLANEIHRPWATAGLLTLAAGTGWSRLDANQHWLSDVVAGAAVGFTSAQLIDRKWRVFHVRPPTILLGARGPVLGWTVSLP